jgi:iron complex transport system substrate-binding protein
MADRSGMPSGNQVIITDAHNNTVVLSHPAKRIVSTSTCAVELLVILGVGDRVVGVTDYQFLNDSVMQGHLPNAVPCGKYLTPSAEKIAILKPDIMITYFRQKPLNEVQLREQGIPVLYVDSCIPSAINNDTLVLARLTGTEANATRYMDFNSRYLSLIESRISSGNVTQPRIYIEQDGAFITHGHGTSGDEMISLLHGKNIAHNLTESALVDREWVVANNPDIIIKAAGDTKMLNPSQVYGEILARPGFSEVTAIKNKKLYIIHSPLTSRPRYIITLLYLAKQVYPDLFFDIDPQEVLREYSEEFVPGSYETENKEYIRYYPPLPAYIPHLQSNNT